MTYAQPSDVAARLGRALTPEETALVAVRIEDVERKIRKRIPDLDAMVTGETLDVQDVIQVEADVVLRLVRNPEGYYSETDGNYSYQFSRDLASGKLEILPEDWTTLGVSPPKIAVLVPAFGDPDSNAMTYNEFVAHKFATGG